MGGREGDERNARPRERSVFASEGEGSEEEEEGSQQEGLVRMYGMYYNRSTAWEFQLHDTTGEMGIARATKAATFFWPLDVDSVTTKCPRPLSSSPISSSSSILLFTHNLPLSLSHATK